MAEEELFTKYYVHQANSGGSDFYPGPIYNQRGACVGSFLGSLYRRILPILKKGSLAIGREVLNSGTNFISELQNNVNPHTAFKDRSREAMANLKRKVLHGDGYKGRKKVKKRQLSTVARRVNRKRRIVKKKPTQPKKKKKKSTLKKKPKDIFN